MPTVTCPATSRAERTLETFGDLARRVVHEGQSADLARAGVTGGDEPGHASDQDPSLAGARAGDDGHWAVDVLCRGALAVVEGRQRQVC